MLTEEIYLKDLKIKAEQRLIELTVYLKDISKLERNTKYIEKLIKTSRKKYNKIFNFSNRHPRLYRKLVR